MYNVLPFILVGIWLLLGFVGGCLSLSWFKRHGGVYTIDYIFFFTVGLIAGPFHILVALHHWSD